MNRCPVTPSSSSTCQLVRGEPVGVAKVVGSWLLRSALIAPGLYLAGIRDRKAIYGALAGSGVISMFLVIYTLAQDTGPRRRRK